METHSGRTASVGMCPEPYLELDSPKGHAKINKSPYEFGGGVKRQDLVYCTDRTKKKVHKANQSHFRCETHPWNTQEHTVIIIIMILVFIVIRHNAKQCWARSIKWAFQMHNPSNTY